jgi:hypothetical protein
VPIEVVLPSGTRLAAITDDAGMSTIAIPASEPARGKVAVRAGSARTMVTYATTPLATAPAVAFSPPGMTGASGAPIADADTPEPVADQQDHGAAQAFSNVGHALRACAVENRVTGVVHAKLAIDGKGSVRATLDRDNADFTACVNELLAGVRFPVGHATKVSFPYML